MIDLGYRGTCARDGDDWGGRLATAELQAGVDSKLQIWLERFASKSSRASELVSL